MTQKTADKYKLKTIADLQPVASQLVLGGPAEWKTRHEGLSGLRDVYGLNFKSFKVLDVGGPLTLSAMKNNQVEVADLLSTSPAIKKIALSYWKTQNICSRHKTLCQSSPVKR